MNTTSVNAQVTVLILTWMNVYLQLLLYVKVRMCIFGGSYYSNCKNMIVILTQIVFTQLHALIHVNDNLMAVKHKSPQGA